MDTATRKDIVRLFPGIQDHTVVEILDTSATLGDIESVRGWYCGAGKVTRARSVLNVNYPARAIADVRGVVVARQGSATDLQVRFARTDGDQYKAQVSERATNDARDSDNRRLEDGYVTVTPLTYLVAPGNV